MGSKERIETNFSNLESDLNKYVKTVLKTAATEIRDEITEQATWAIARFYMDYTPKYYSRHYNNFMDKSYRKYYSNAHGTIFRGGVEFTPDAMSDVYTSSTSEVFDMVYAGMHGPSTAYWGNPSAMQPSPMELIIFKKEEIENNIQKYINRGIEKAHSGNYSILKFN